MNFRIERHTADCQPSEKHLLEICELFANNLPVLDEQSTDENKGVLAAHQTPDDLRRLLIRSKTFLLAHDTHDRVAGILEWDARDKGAMLAYISWLIVGREYRGQGVSSLLHGEFETRDVSTLAARVTQEVYQALTVNLKNPALHIYRKWGYEDAPLQWNDGRRLIMSKGPIPVNPVSSALETR